MTSHALPIVEHDDATLIIINRIQVETSKPQIDKMLLEINRNRTIR